MTHRSQLDIMLFLSIFDRDEGQACAKSTKMVLAGGNDIVLSATYGLAQVVA